MLKPGRLKHYCNLPETEFPGKEIHPYPHRLLFTDRGSDILAIAHLDSVSRDDRFFFLQGKTDSIAYSRRLDNRLGAYIILEILPQMGIHADVLLTTNEESVNSTAQYFVAPRQYRWAVSFDREGNDCVLYHYEDYPKLVDAIQQFYPLGFGSYSDICELSIGCAGMNIGNGLSNGHSPTARVSFSTLAYQLRQFKRFYKQFRNTKFTYEDTRDHARWYRYGRGKYRSSWVGWSSVRHTQPLADMCETCTEPPCDLCSLQDICEGCPVHKEPLQFWPSECPMCGCWGFYYIDDNQICGDCDFVMEPHKTYETLDYFPHSMWANKIMEEVK